jgi:hypothetical protein
MAAAKKTPGWYPADDIQAEKAAQGEVYKGQDGEYYQHENMPTASPKNPPAPAAPAPVADISKKPEAGPQTPPTPSAADLDAVAAEEAAKEATAAPVAPKQVLGGPQSPSYDSDKFDSTGKNVKTDPRPGPRGQNLPPDVMTDEERAASAKKAEAKLASGLASTHAIDSVGNKKGSFEVVPQGNDKHGARIPDEVDYSKPVQPVAAQVGPRGKNAPKDTFHRT